MEQEKLQSLLEFTAEVVAGQAQLMQEMARRIEGQQEEIQMLAATLERTIEELDREISSRDYSPDYVRGVSDELDSMCYDAGTIGKYSNGSLRRSDPKEKQAPIGSYNFKIENSDNFTTKKETK